LELNTDKQEERHKMLAWTLILSTIIPLYNMDRFQRKDSRKINREERRTERKEVREIRRWQKDGIEKGTLQESLLLLKVGLAHTPKW